MRINLKHFLDYASHKNPRVVAAAVIAAAKKHGGQMKRRGMGDASSGMQLDPAAMSYVLSDPNVINLAVTGAAPGFLPDGSSNPLANPVVTDSTGAPVNAAPWWQTLFTSITNAAPNLLTAYTANQQLTACSQTNQARLSQGLPPVDCSSFAPTANLGLSPATSSLFLLLGGGALLLMFVGGRRRTQ